MMQVIYTKYSDAAIPELKNLVNACQDDILAVQRLYPEAGWTAILAHCIHKAAEIGAMNPRTDYSLAAAQEPKV